jgi:hypothetical protein
MAPTTRSMACPRRGLSTLKSAEYDTPQKSRFYVLFDAKSPSQSLKSFAEAQNIPRTTARNWLQQRDVLGSPACRRIRQKASNLGRPQKLSKSQCKALVLPSKNNVRNQPYQTQIAYHNLDVGVRTIQRSMARETKQAQRYKQAYIKKKLSPENRYKRQQYGHEHQDETIDSFF